MTRKKFIIQLCFFTFLLIGKTTVFAQTSSNKIELDSISQYILLSKESDSIKIAKLNTLISQHRYADYTLPSIVIAKKIALKSKNPVLLADNYRSLGNYYFYNSELDSAEYYLLKSKKIASKHNIPFINAAIDNALGGVYRKKGNITQAIKSVLASKAILENVDTLKLSASKKRQLLSEKLILYNTLANFYNQMGDFTQSIENYDKAYHYALKINSIRYAGVILSNKGDLLLKNNKYNEALSVLKKARELKVNAKAQATSIANTDQNISLALSNIGQLDLALKYINDAIAHYEEKNIILHLMESYTIRGRIYYKQNKFQKAIDDCNKSKLLAIKNGFLEVQENACLCLSDSYEKTNNYKKALENFKQYQKMHEVVFNDNNIKKITQLEMQYKHEKENEVREMEIALKEKENKATIKTLLIGIFSLLLISGLLYRLYLIRQKANKALSEKNSKISETLAINNTLFKETHHRVKNNLQIISSLLSMQSKYLQDAKSKEIIIDSQNRIKSMSLIHQKLYQEKHITGIETSIYFNELINSLIHSYGINTEKVKIDTQIENLVLDVDTAIPLGLILNEIISNAFKHGINHEKSQFSFIFKKNNSTQLIVIVKDSGKGLSDDFDWKKSKSYGMKLIHTLSNKLKADIQFISNNGLEVKIIINKFKLSHE